MARHIACFSFDFDAHSGFVQRKMMTPTPISRGEFCAVGVNRILRLMRGRSIETTFFIPGVVMETYPELTRAIHDHGHEIGNHGWTHEWPADLAPDVEEADLVRASETIIRLTGQKPRGYRSAAFDLSPSTVGLLLKYGFLYETSMMAHDSQPYQVRSGDFIDPRGPMVFGKETDLIEMPVSWNLDDFPHFEFMRSSTTILPGLMHADGVLRNWVDDFRYMVQNEDWGVLTFTFHPFVIGRGHRMLFLERLIDELKDLGAVFMKIEDAAHEYKKRRLSASVS